ncbi:MAG: DNA-binding transcriptional MocR family regulator [Candidatus Azotimanducaceae bacterium]|jgi:DNA-binding transcriptional MocR family regulator
MKFSQLPRPTLISLQESLEAQYETFRQAKLNLDLTRGKPAAEQLDLSNELDGILQGFYLLQDGTDVRNYGGLLGIPEARQLAASFLEVDADEVMVGGNSSLTLMYAYIDHMLPTWLAELADDTDRIKFICPVPGYDRHFTICDHFDIEMLTVPLLADGPDMAQIEAMVEQDPLIKGIWCVPKYSNPTGHTYSDAVVEQFARLSEKAGEHFTIFWDNAYAVHHLTDTHDSLKNLMQEARAQGNQNSVVILGSTSKVTFAGAGIAFLATSLTNLKRFEKHMSVSVIGFDKVNQLRHVRFLKDAETIEAHMHKHREIIQPKFEMTEKVLDEHLGGKGIATWTRPRGGYFISLDTLPNLATEVIRQAAAIGVKLTPAGATFPGGQDPVDSNIRIAPTFPSLDALQRALEVFVVCLQLATVNQILSD